MDPLFQTSLLGASATLYPDHLVYKQLGKKEQSIPLTQIKSVKGAMMGMQRIFIELRGGQKITCIVKLKDKEKICTAIMEARESKISEDTKKGINHDEDPLMEARVACPKCGSTQITAQKKGWSLATGFLGSNKVFITCLVCGRRFRPGAAPQVLRSLAVLFIVALSMQTAHATSGCCALHGGVNSCDAKTGYDLCQDGSDSPSCTCSAVKDSSSASSKALSSSSIGDMSFKPDARVKTSHCIVTNAVQDHACTPGAIFNVTASQICKAGYAKSVRAVTTATKNKVFAEYGMKAHSSSSYEVDHLISLELGGSNDIANLWPEAVSPSPGFHEKDKVENYLHTQVCNGSISLAEAQKEISSNWLSVYQRIGK